MPQRISEPMPYPQRESYFAHRFLRLLTKMALAMELGDSACWLLTVIVMQEDACRYRRPVRFFQGQLCALCGWSDERTLIRTRSLLSGAGWLHYVPGGVRQAGSYFVLIPPHAEGLGDAPSAEGYPPSDAAWNGGHRGGHREGHDGGPSSLFPIPIPKTPTAAPSSSGSPRTTAPTRPVRVEGIDRPGVQIAIREGKLYRLLRAMGCTTTKDLRPEWPMRSDGLSLHALAVVLGWRWRAGDPVRMPSGLTQAREAWRALPEADRRTLSIEILTDLGVPVPPMRGTPHPPTGPPQAP